MSDIGKVEVRSFGRIGRRSDEALGLDKYTGLTGRDVRTDKKRAYLPDCTYRYYDGLAKKPDGTYEGVEVKGNSATYGGRQLKFDNQVSATNPARVALDGKEVLVTSVRVVWYP